MKKTTIFLLILLAVFFTSTLYFLYLNKFKSKPVVNSVPTVKLIPTIVPTVQWKLYTNKEYAFSFSYPSDWTIIENSISDTVSAITADKKAHQIEIKHQNQTILLINPELPLGYGNPFTLSTAIINSKKINVYTYGSSPTKHYTNFNLPNFPEFSIDTYGQNPEITQILSTFKFTNSTNNKKGTVTGNLCYPSEGIPPGTIIAKNISTGETFSQKYPGTTVYPSTEFSFQLNPGTYHFKFELNDGVSGYYNKCAKTMELVDCTPDENHQPLSVVVDSNKTTTGVSICDFYFSQEQETQIKSNF